MNVIAKSKKNNDNKKVMANIDNILLPYQKEFVLCDSKFIRVEKSRRIGMTYAAAVKAILTCINKDWDCWFSSSNKTVGLEFIIYVKQFGEALNIITGAPIIDLENSTTTTVVLINGKRITSLTSNPDCFRSHDGLIIIDEMAFHENQEAIYTSGSAAIAQKGQIICISTHNGENTAFYKLMDKERFKNFRITIDDAMDQGWIEKFRPNDKREDILKEFRDGSFSEPLFLQEYYCKTSNITTTLINSDKYKACIFTDLPVYDYMEDRSYNDCYVGIDIGATKDLTVIWAVEEYLNPDAKDDLERYDYRTVCVLKIKNEIMDLQWEKINKIIKHKSIVSVAYDGGLRGFGLADKLEDNPKCIPVYFGTRGIKQLMAEKLAGYVEKQRINMPDDDQVMDDFIAVKRISTASGIKYEGKTKESHCDTFWAAGMALYAASQSGHATIVG